MAGGTLFSKQRCIMLVSFNYRRETCGCHLIKAKFSAEVFILKQVSLIDISHCYYNVIPHIKTSYSPALSKKALTFEQDIVRFPQ